MQFYVLYSSKYNKNLSKHFHKPIEYLTIEGVHKMN